MDVLFIIMVVVVLLALICIVFTIIMDVTGFKKKDKPEKEAVIKTPKTDMTFGAILRSNLRMTDKDIGIIGGGEIVYPKKTDIYTQVDKIRNVVSVNVKCEFDYDEVFDLMRKRKDGV